MSKEPVKAAPAEEADEFEQTLEEFCTNLSGTDKRVELIGAFHAKQAQLGRLKALPSAFASDFAAFASAPA